MFRQIISIMVLVLFLLFLWVTFVPNAVAQRNPELFLEGNVLAAGNYNAGADSSDITLIIRIVTDDGEILVDEGMAIGYTVPQDDIDDWTEVDFDDSDWQAGTSGVGYGDGDDNTGVRAGNVLSVYTRYYFDAPNARNMDNITVMVDYDDGYILWLNGEHICGSVNAPGGDPPAWNTPGGGHEATVMAAGKPNEARWNAAGIDKWDISVDFGGQMPEGSAGKPPEGTSNMVTLYKTDNVLAGANFNDGPGSSDMTLIMRLMGDDEIYIDEGSEVKYIHDPDNADVGDDWIQVEFDDRDWADGISGVGFSDGDDNTTVPAGLMSIWTRYYFDAPNADKVSELVLLADYDDAFLAWLNGKPLAFGGGAPLGDPPAWNASQGGCANRGALEMPAGEPNKARWNAGGVESTTVSVRYGGSSAMAVSPKSKLTTTWGNVKEQN